MGERAERLESIDLDALLAGAAQIYVGIMSGGNPHVTPELFATTGGRLLCMTAANTQKAKVLAADEQVAFMTPVESGAVVGLGRATIVNPAKPTSLIGEVTRSAVGVTRFAARNAAELSGAAMDALVGKLGRPLPAHRVALSIVPTAVAVLTEDGVKVAGGWDAAVRLAAGSQPQETNDLDDCIVTEEQRDLLGDGPAALGWSTNGGHPLVLPARWERSTGSARVNAALFRACGSAAFSAAAVTRDTWTGYGPTGKQGVMLRGHAAATSVGDEVAVDVAVARVTFWDGVRTDSTNVS